MKGLFLKDLYLIRKYCRTLLLIAVIFIGASIFGDNNMFLIFYPCILISVLPLTLYSYDEKEKWCIYSATFPVSKAQYVSAKYLIGLFSTVTVILLTAIAQFFRMVSSSSFLLEDYLSLLTSLSVVSLIFPSVTMPLIFKFGSEKGRIAYFAIIGAICGIVIITQNLTEFTPAAIGKVTMITVCIAAFLLYTASWLLSILFYKKREL